MKFKLAILLCLKFQSDFCQINGARNEETAEKRKFTNGEKQIFRDWAVRIINFESVHKIKFFW